ncbi:DNA-binding protein [Halosegnis rubeus]|uniref:DNA-binding protein n=1 Tax=Halosegnis rubeus TaxID=2212850 RepID=A0A5N5ULU9_9EURY|nr:NOB1 family endonuclease [Halosegnis rubeus]KAB7514581.1 DNA-binding protein [Halosegnis rubeus]KAB7517915.1 DNA-binding protein [Halosegnis rubeus]KAB7519505.1 DNA-binding protein [Halosegnis rubeus]
MRVLDASAFIDDYTTDDEMVTVPAVREELTDDASGYRFDALEGAGMRLHVPGEGPQTQVERAARTTGDFTEISDVDRRLLAAAFELDAVLVTDDYAMQNVANELDVTTESVSKEGIEERRDWDYQCQGCGRVYGTHRERCEICGSDLERKNPQ